DHHRERYQNIERCNKHNQANRDERDHAFEPERPKQWPILLLPIRAHEAFSRSILNLSTDLGGFVDVVNLHLDNRNYVSQAEKRLRIFQPDEPPGAVVIVKT